LGAVVGVHAMLVALLQLSPGATAAPASRPAAAPRLVPRTRPSTGRAVLAALPRPDPAPLTLSVQSAAAPASAPTPDAVASAPLRLDPGTLRRALAAGPSRMERQAQAAGQTLRPVSASRDEKLAAAIDAASKPDCLGPNGGGSLLSAVTIALAYAADKCK
jgi:hypothetical protein